MAQEQHQMELVETHDTGAEEWHCPQCQCRFVMQWAPYKKVVLEEGDNYALHSAKKGDIQLGTPRVNDRVESDDLGIMSNELRDALDNFLKDLDFGD